MGEKLPAESRSKAPVSAPFCDDPCNRARIIDLACVGVVGTWVIDDGDVASCISNQGMLQRVVVIVASHNFAVGIDRRQECPDVASATCIEIRDVTGRIAHEAVEFASNIRVASDNFTTVVDGRRKSTLTAIGTGIPISESMEDAVRIPDKGLPSPS